MHNKTFSSDFISKDRDWLMLDKMLYTLNNWKTKDRMFGCKTKRDH